MPYSYLLWLFIFTIVPLGVLWFLFWDTLHQYSGVIAVAPIGALIFSIPWDGISIHEGVWYFQTPYIVGLSWGGLPLEQYLFYIFATLLFATVSALIWKRYGSVL